MGAHSAEPDDLEPVNTQTMSTVVTSLIRTWVPIGVGALLAWGGATAHVVIPPHASAAVGAFAATACAAAYYALARLLERSSRTALRTAGRYMLGGVVPPVYLDAATAARALR